MTSSMANGALGYWKVWTSSNVIRRIPDSSIEKAVEKYFKTNPKIDYSSLNRITAK